MIGGRHSPPPLVVRRIPEGRTDVRPNCTHFYLWGNNFSTWAGPAFRAQGYLRGALPLRIRAERAFLPGQKMRGVRTARPGPSLGKERLSG